MKIIIQILNLYMGNMDQLKYYQYILMFIYLIIIIKYLHIIKYHHI
jgi:hypothetical protein